MTFILAIGLMSLQASEEIDRQIRRIDGEDPRASFDAVARLMALPDKSRDAVAGAAAGIRDPFYREVLRSELEAREKLGERYGRERRVSVRGGRPAKAVVRDLEAAGIHVRTRHLEAFEKEDAVELALEDVAPLEVLGELCRKTGAEPYGGGPGVVNLTSGRAGEFTGVAFRHFLVHAGGVRRAEVADFAGAPKRGIAVGLTLFWESGVEVSSVSDPVVLEAVDEKGKALAPAEAGFVPALAEQYRERSELQLGDPQPSAIGFAPTSSAKIARLRGYVTVGIPVETSEFTFAKPAVAATAEDGHFVVRLGGLWPFDTQVGGAADAQVGIQIRPKRGSEEDFRKRTMAVLFVGPEGSPCYRFWGRGRFEKGEAAYRGLAVTERQEASALTVKIHRAAVSRRVYFDLRNIALQD